MNKFSMLLNLLRGNVIRRNSLHLLSLALVTSLNNLVVFLAQIWAAKVLGAGDFGALSIAFSVAVLVGAVGDFGLSLTTVRLFNKYEDPKTRGQLFGVVFIFRLSLLAFLFVIAQPLSKLLASFLGINSESFLLAIALLTGGFLLFWNHLQSYLQSYRLFTHLVVYNLAYAAFRVVFLWAGFVFLNRSPLAWLMAAYTGPTLLLFLIALLPKTHEHLLVTLTHLRRSLDLLKQALRYSQWTAVSNITYISMPYVARFVLALRGSLEDVGVFSVGMAFTMAFATLTSALQAVFFPQVTALEGREQMVRYLEKIRSAMPYYFGFSLGGVLLLLLLQGFVIGEEYHVALLVFSITAGASLVSVPVYLVTMLLHTMMRPEIDAIVNLFRLMIFIVLALLAADYFGVLGVAFAYGIVSILASVVKYVWVVKMLRSEA